MDTNEIKIRMSGRKYYIIEIILALLVSLALGFIPLLDMLIPFVWLLAIISIIITYIYVRNYWIKLDEDGLSISKGILNVKTLFIPYANVDNVGMDTKIIDRILGLTEIKIDTKGRADVEVILKNIPTTHAIRVIDLVRKKIINK